MGLRYNGETSGYLSMDSSWFGSSWFLVILVYLCNIYIYMANAGCKKSLKYCVRVYNIRLPRLYLLLATMILTLLLLHCHFWGKEHALADTYTRLQVYVLIFVEAETSAKYATERHTGMVSFLINKELERVYRVYPLALPSSYCKTLTTLLPTIRGFFAQSWFYYVLLILRSET